MPAALILVVSQVSIYLNFYSMHNHPTFCQCCIATAFFKFTLGFIKYRLRKEEVLRRGNNLLAVLMIVVIFFLWHDVALDYISSIMKNDDKLKIYLPTLLLILCSEIILSNKRVLNLINRGTFLILFRLKHCLCLILMPRLWYGDQSVVLKSHLYTIYQYLFWGSTALFLGWILAEGLINLYNGKYPTLFPEGQGERNQTANSKYHKFYELKQRKFELILIFSLNLAPVFILMNGQPSFIRTLCLLFNLIGVVYLVSQLRYSFSNAIAIVFSFFMLHVIFMNELEIQKPNSTYLTACSEGSLLQVTFLSFLKNCSTLSLEFLVFATYAAYSVKCPKG